MKNKKIAIIHYALQDNTKGGGEVVDFAIRDYYDADFWTITYSDKNWNNSVNDDFVKKLWEKPFKYLAKESKIPVWRKIKRILTCLTISKKNLKQLEGYDVVFFSDDIPFLSRKIAQPKKVLYRHTNPIFLSPENYLAKKPTYLKIILKIVFKLELNRFKKDLKKYDKIISNSNYTAKILKQKTRLKSDTLFPPVNVDKYKFEENQGYYLSFARLDEQKRIKLIVNSFQSQKLSGKKLIIAHNGELEKWVKKEIKNYPNISYVGSVNKKKLQSLISHSIAGIYIPNNEGAGISQIEFMASGKPVIGVKEGGLLETIIDGQTGFLIKQNPDKHDLIEAVLKMTSNKAKSMKEGCLKQAKKFNSQSFFKKLDKIVNTKKN